MRPECADHLQPNRITLVPDTAPARAPPENGTGEVDGLFHFERIPLESFGPNVERPKGVCQAPRGKDRRIDPCGEQPDSLERGLDLRDQSLEHAARGGLVGVEKLLRELERYHRRGEILLDAVVQGLLDPPAFPVEFREHQERVCQQLKRGQHDSL